MQSIFEFLQRIHYFLAGDTWLDHVSTYFPLFQFEKCIYGLTVCGLCYSCPTENKRAGSNLVQPSVIVITVFKYPISTVYLVN